MDQRTLAPGTVNIDVKTRLSLMSRFHQTRLLSRNFHIAKLLTECWVT